MSKGSDFSGSGVEKVNAGLEGDITLLASLNDDIALQLEYLSTTLANTIEAQNTLHDDFVDIEAEILSLTASLSEFVDPESDDYVALVATINSMDANLESLSDEQDNPDDTSVNEKLINKNNMDIRDLTAQLDSDVGGISDITDQIRSLTTQLDTGLEVFAARSVAQFELQTKKDLLTQEMTNQSTLISEFESQDYVGGR